MSGIQVKVFNASGEEQIAVKHITDEVSFVGDVTEETAYLLEVSVPSRFTDSVEVLSVDGKRTLRRKTVYEGDDGSGEYEMKIAVTNPTWREGKVWKSNTHVFRTVYASNHFKAIIFDPSRFGLISIWNFGIIVQDRKAFLIVHSPFKNVQVYKDGSDAVCPVANWDGLNSFLTEYYGYGVQNLSQVEEYHPTQPDVSDLEDNEARVLFFSYLMGTGAVKLANGRTCKVHWTSIERRNGVAYLLPGEKVKYLKRTFPHQGGRGTTYGSEIKGVTVIS